ncbi:MAG: protein adenylyltransferase SelO family protein, partial [Pseudomonadota bacterium]
AKLGLQSSEAEDHQLAADFLKLLEKTEADYHTVWRSLSTLAQDRKTRPEAISADIFESHWWDQWSDRLEREDADLSDIESRLDAANPKFVLRNWVAETAIRAVEDEFDLGALDQIFRLVTNPFAEHGEDDQKFSMPPPADLCGLAVSCSS